MNFQKLMNNLLELKVHAEQEGLSAKQIANLKIVEEIPPFNQLEEPELEFELSETPSGKLVIQFKKNKNQNLL